MMQTLITVINYKHYTTHIGGTVMAYKLSCHSHVHGLCTYLTNCKPLAAKYSHSETISEVETNATVIVSPPPEMVICQTSTNTKHYSHNYKAISEYF